jgi:hypothetical protein
MHFSSRFFLDFFLFFSLTCRLELSQAINTPIQGGAADVVTMAMINIFNNQELRKIGWKMVLQVGRGLEKKRGGKKKNDGRITEELRKNYTIDTLANLQSTFFGHSCIHKLRALYVFFNLKRKNRKTTRTRARRDPTNSLSSSLSLSLSHARTHAHTHAHAHTHHNTHTHTHTQVHDEIILEGPEKDAAVAYKIVQECMEKPFAPRKVFRFCFSFFFFLTTFSPF